jgi:DNA-binding response OmpR family regulator
MHKRNEPRVLVIENNDALRAMLFTILRHQPVEVDTAITAEDAWTKVTNCDYALIVIDMDLPEMAGQSFLARFLAERSEAPTFILAVRNPGDDNYLDPAVVSAVLNKPLEIDTLAELVRECSLVVPPPDNPLPCPPADSEIRTRMERTPYISN